jgi:hypothetical protein
MIQKRGNRINAKSEAARKGQLICEIKRFKKINRIILKKLD